MTAEWPRKGHQVTELKLPRHYGSVPTLFGSPKVESLSEVTGSDLCFVGIPWQAPVPDSRIGAAGANYFGTNLTPHSFRTNSVKYNGYLPERDIDVFETLRLVDFGDLSIDNDLSVTFDHVANTIEQISQKGVIPVTTGGNSGPSTYAVVKGIAAASSQPVAVFNFDAHGDNHAGEIEDDDPKLPPWGATWARRILDIPNVDPARYHHFGLRGPRNDSGTIQRFLEKGVERSMIMTYEDIVTGRREGFESWSRKQVEASLADGAKAWIVIDPDSLDMSVSPEFGDEPLGMYPEEICWASYQIGKLSGRKNFGGISFTALPYSAMTIHWIMMYIMLYAFAGILHGDGTHE